MSISVELEYAQHVKALGWKSLDDVAYKYVGTHWQAAGGDELSKDALVFLAENHPDKATAKAARGCADTAIMCLPRLEKRGSDATLIPVKNGTLEIDKDGQTTVREHRAEDALTYLLAAEYNNSARGDEFDAFLRSVLPSSQVRDWLQEYAGYTLLSDCRHQIAVWLVGPGGNGKSTFAEIMQALHSRPVSMTLDALDGFKLEGLIGASLIYCDETPKRVDEQRLKTLVSGDAVQIDRKYQKPLTIRPTAKWIVSGNALPAISDHSDGFWRRWVVVPFAVKVTQRKPLLAAWITSNELSGVLVWAVEGLRRLLSRGRFPDLPVEMKDAQRAGKLESDSVMSWWAEAEVAGVGVGEQAKSPKNDIYCFYSNWCKTNGMAAMSSSRFWPRLKQNVDSIQEWRAREAHTQVQYVNIYSPQGSGLPASSGGFR